MSTLYPRIKKEITPKSNTFILGKKAIMPINVSKKETRVIKQVSVSATSILVTLIRKIIIENVENGKN